MREFSGLHRRRKFNSFNWFKLTIMNKKEALIRCLRTAAWLLIALIPVVAGIIMARKRKEDGLV